MTDAPHPLHHCLRCRHSAQFGAGSSEPILWCRLNEATCKAACPGYERYPGAEGDDD